jgi:hypothetical protein
MPWQSSSFTPKQQSHPLNIQQVDLVWQYENSRKRHAQCSLHSTYHLKMLLEHVIRWKMLQMGKQQVEGHQSKNLGHLTWKLINSMHLATTQKLSNALDHLMAFPCKQWVQFVEMFSLTGDNIFTFQGEAEYQKVKRYYKQASKCDYTWGIAKQNHWEWEFWKISELEILKDALDSMPNLSSRNEDVLPAIAPDIHHYMSHETKNKIDLSKWLWKNNNDPACKVQFQKENYIHVHNMVNGQNFTKKLKNHLLNCILGLEYDGNECDFTSCEWNYMIVKNNSIYTHQVVQINYTTYDVHRAQDFINLTTGNSYFMVLGCENEAHKDPHPYWYGRIIGVYHAKVIYTGPKSCSLEPQIMEFLWVCWMGWDPNNNYHDRWTVHQLPQIRFVHYEDEAAFGFLNPSLILQAVHLIPCFSLGRTKELLPQRSLYRLPNEKDEDWDMFYVNMWVCAIYIVFDSIYHHRFVDCNMFMHF